MAAMAHDTYRTGERSGTTFSDETSPEEEVSSLLAVVVEDAVEAASSGTSDDTVYEIALFRVAADNLPAL